MDLSRCPDRRCVLVAGAAGTAALLTGCSTYGRTDPAPAAPPAAAATSPTAAASSPGSEPPEPADEESTAAAVDALAAVEDVPVGGGVVLADAKLVLTRPDEATVKAFTAVCTHAGCVVSDVDDGTIRCACHGSEFSATDGSVTGGPAPAPLAEVPVRVEGGQVVRA